MAAMVPTSSLVNGPVFKGAEEDWSSTRLSEAQPQKAPYEIESILTENV